jgi:2-oxo-4-hydroxy-4-carboxy-5-ureidoimidazoline decarboxylase
MCETLQEFLALCGNVFEHSPWLVERVWYFRPFADGNALYAAFYEALHALNPAEQLRLFTAHPELADKVAIAAGMTDDSVAEQASAGLDRLSPEEFASFQSLNDDYRRKHGFPFIICARLHGKQEILQAMQTRLARGSDEERQEAIEQISRICRFRVEALLAH